MCLQLLQQPLPGWLAGKGWALALTLLQPLLLQLQQQWQGTCVPLLLLLLLLLLVLLVC
jgi:hypothetical protein